MTAGRGEGSIPLRPSRRCLQSPGHFYAPNPFCRERATRRRAPPPLAGTAVTEEDPVADIGCSLRDRRRRAGLGAGQPILGRGARRLCPGGAGRLPCLAPCLAGGVGTGPRLLHLLLLGWRGLANGTNFVLGSARPAVPTCHMTPRLSTCGLHPLSLDSRNCLFCMLRLTSKARFSHSLRPTFSLLTDRVLFSILVTQKPNPRGEPETG